MRIIDSFRYAVRGIAVAYREERQMKVHTVAAAVAVLCGVAADLSRAEWAILALTIAMVITLELVNTAVERTVDMVTKEYHPLAEKAKEIEAAINAKKDAFFAEFETAHSDDIAAIETALAAKKAELKNIISGEAQ